MSRIARVILPGEPHHLIQRGNRRAAVFHADEERHAYLRLLREYGALHGLAVWAYCLMTNHVHLVAVPRDAESVALALRGVHTVYAMQYNTRHRGTGHLWQGRYRSCPMDHAHAWAAVRYVERNPVRAGMVARAEDYPWSSAQAHCGLRRDALLDPGFPAPGIVEDWHERLRHPDDETHVRALRSATNIGRPCGSGAYCKQIEGQLSRTLMPQLPGRPRKNLHPEQQDLAL